MSRGLGWGAGPHPSRGLRPGAPGPALRRRRQRVPGPAGRERGRGSAGVTKGPWSPQSPDPPPAASPGSGLVPGAAPAAGTGGRGWGCPGGRFSGSCSSFSVTPVPRGVFAGAESRSWLSLFSSSHRKTVQVSLINLTHSASTSITLLGLDIRLFIHFIVCNPQTSQCFLPGVSVFSPSRGKAQSACQKKWWLRNKCKEVKQVLR